MIRDTDGDGMNHELLKVPFYLAPGLNKTGRDPVVPELFYCRCGRWSQRVSSSPDAEGPWLGDGYPFQPWEAALGFAHHLRNRHLVEHA